MKKLDYFKYCLHNGTAKKVHWVKTVLGVIRNADVKKLYPGVLKVEPWGLSFFNSEGVWEKIEDSKVGEPLLTIRDRFVADSTWLSSIQSPIETTVGRMLWNYYTVFYAFGGKFQYVNDPKANISSVEKQIVDRRKDLAPGETKSDAYCYVDEYIKYHEGVLHLEHLAPLVSVSLTKKAISPPAGIKEFKAELLKKYDGQLHDPVKMAEFKSELAKFDDEYMKGDASKHFVKGKVKDNGRMRIYLTTGTDIGFENKLTVTPVPNSLSEGWPTDPEQFTTLMNGIRKGSYDRGAETVNGGVAAKVLLRAANHITIEDTDCRVPYGMPKIYTAKSINKLVGRTIIDGGKSVLIENKNQAANFIGRLVQVRSVSTCRLSGDKKCKVCAGARLSMYPKGLTIPLTEISNILLYDSMKAMHDSTLKLAEYKIHDVLT